MEKHIRIKITGKVQGVSFRYHTKSVANELNVKGFVKNNYDGSVYIEVSGKTENIDHFINWCYTGPKWAIVEDLQISENSVRHFNTFSVK